MRKVKVKVEIKVMVDDESEQEICRAIQECLDKELDLSVIQVTDFEELNEEEE
jgi:ABC-type metal ion transport system substrate-binding protein